MKEKFRGKYRIDSVRLKGWNYSWPGFYFITICVKDRKRFFGRIVEGKMILSDMGEIVNQCWKEIPDHFENVMLDEFVVMPDHVHGIIVLENDIIETQHCCVSTKKQQEFYYLSPKSLPVIIRSFKSACSYKINKKHPYIGFQWQSKYYDHIIRNQKAFENIQRYIYFNPQKWHNTKNKT